MKYLKNTYTIDLNGSVISIDKVYSCFYFFDKGSLSSFGSKAEAIHVPLNEYYHSVYNVAKFQDSHPSVPTLVKRIGNTPGYTIRKVFQRLLGKHNEAFLFLNQLVVQERDFVIPT